MKCPECASECPDNSPFCAQCGCNLRPDAVQSRSAPPPPVPSQVASPFVPPSPVPLMPLTSVVITVPTKSVGVAILLAILFGPLGMLYSTVGGAIIMIITSVVVMLFTFGFGVFITWPICVIWAAVAASNHNQRLLVRV